MSEILPGAERRNNPKLLDQVRASRWRLQPGFPVLPFARSRESRDA